MKIMPECNYTLEDLETAKQDLKTLREKWENYSGNNSNKYQSEIRSATSMVRVIRGR
jgi:hypothetical protein